MRLVVLGVNHRTAPLPVREELAVPTDAVERFLERLAGREPIAEAMLVSTCNRVELFAVPSGEGGDARASLRDELAAERGVSAAWLDRQAYGLEGREAVHHLLRVACSLDSMVVGEPQILGQVKESTALARRAGTVGPLLGRMTDRAFAAAKAVRTETGLGRGVVSIGSVAVDLARHIFDRLDDCRVLLIGAGHMAEATARSLSEAGAGRVLVANRSRDRAVAMADRYGWEACPLADPGELLREADVVITSTGSARPILDARAVRPVIPARKYRPLFLVDIAVPRDVRDDVGTLEMVYLYNVDDLEGISSTRRAEREEEVAAAEALVREELERLDAWYRSLELKPTIKAIRHRADELAREELARTLDRRLSYLGDEERRALDKMLDALVSKLLHPTMEALRERREQLDGPGLVAAARLLHGVEDRDEEAAGEPVEGGAGGSSRRCEPGNLPTATELDDAAAAAPAYGRTSGKSGREGGGQP